jgi:hypothetical protein
MPTRATPGVHGGAAPLPTIARYYLAHRCDLRYLSPGSDYNQAGLT